MSKMLLTLSAIIILASIGTAAEPTKDQREKMAQVHTKMADCLKSSKPMEDCRKEMMQNCQSMMGSSGCPMMGEMDHGMMGKGKMMNKMMNQGADEEKK